MYERILVPTDGSDRAAVAVTHAFDLAERDGADVHLLFVADSTLPAEPALSGVVLSVDAIEAEGDQILKRALTRGERRGLHVQAHSCHGTPAEEIEKYADSVDADLVVMGIHGSTHRGGLGSTTERVLRTSERPVLTV